MNVLIVVDMQNDFITGALGTPEARAIVANVVKRIQKSENELILFTKDTHSQNYLNTKEGKKLPVPHCIEGTEGYAVDSSVINAWRNNKGTLKDLSLNENAFKKYVFGSTALADYLKRRANEIEKIEILGLCTDICVVSNALMIKNTLPDVDICVNAACCAGVTQQSHLQAINVMRMCQIDIV